MDQARGKIGAAAGREARDDRDRMIGVFGARAAKWDRGERNDGKECRYEFD